MRRFRKLLSMMIVMAILVMSVCPTGVFAEEKTTIEAKSMTFTYDGTYHQLDVTVSGPYTSIEYRVNGGEPTNTPPSFRDVSRESQNRVINYTVGIIVKDGDVQVAGKGVSVRVVPKPVTVTAENKEKTYGDADPALTAKVEGLVEGESVAYTLTREEGEDVREGGYGISFVKPQADQGNYVVTFVSNAVLSINPSDALSINGSDMTLTYDGQPHTFTATASDSNGTTIKYSTNKGESWSTTAPSFTDAGDYEVKVRAENSNYSNTPEETYSVRIKQASLTINAEDLTVTYDGQEHRVKVSVYPSFAALEFSRNNMTWSAVNPGYTDVVRAADGSVISQTLYIQAVTSNPNYKPTQKSVEVKIEPSDALSINDANTVFTYNGQAQAFTATASDSKGTTISYSTDNGTSWSTTAPSFKDAGEYKVQVKAENSNYSNTPQKEFIVTVYQKAVTVTAENKEKTYGETDPVLTATIEGLVEGESEELIAYKLTREEGETVRDGGYKISFVDPQADQGNYAVTFISGAVLSIKPSDALSITGSDMTLTYNGQPQTFTATASVEEGTTVSYSTDEGKNWSTTAPSFKDAGEYKVLVKAENNNYEADDKAFTVTVNQKAVTVTAGSKEKTYGDADPALTATVEGLVEGESEELIAYKLTREEGEDVGDYKISFVEPQADQGNYVVTFVSDAVLSVKQKAVTVTADCLSKPFGHKDPVLTATVEGLVEGESVAYTLTREKGEKLGNYAVSFDEPQTSQGNYAVTFVGNTFSITTEGMNLTLKLGEVNTHSSSLSYHIESADENVELIDSISENVELTASFSYDNAEGKPVVALPTNMTLTCTAIDDKTGTITLPELDYSASLNGQNYAWKSYLPVGAQITFDMDVLQRDENLDPSNLRTGADVKSVYVVLGYAFAAGENMTKHGEDSDALLDENGTAAVAITQGDEYVSDSDWLVLTVGGETCCLQKKDLQTLTLDALKQLSLAGETEDWFGTNPAGKLALDVTLLDEANHIALHDAQKVAFDTGAEDSTDVIGNRAEDAMNLSIKDSVGGNVNVTGSFGGSTPSVTAENGLIWSNVADWKLTPATLPHSGDVITVTYSDLVGHTVSHVITVVRSTAATRTSLRVKPMTDETVPSGKLVFFGDANVWEQLVLTVGGRTFSIDALAGGETYDNTAKQWTRAVNLADIDFPVGVPTRVAIAYEDLEGGEAAFVVTYKDQAQTPVLCGEPIVGANSVWGFVEADATVMADIRHQDGTVSAVPAANVAVDQFGYFCVRLTEALAEGDVVIITTTDFCGNTDQIAIGARKELADGAVAELLGANIVGELENGEMAHRFATPVDLAALYAQETRSIELPILAYKGIEIGKATLTLTEEGRLELAYSISATDYIPENAQARMSVYDKKPGIEELVNGDHEIRIEKLIEADQGVLDAVDVTGYQGEDGAYSGVIWIMAEFDIDMDETNYNSRGGRGVNFYRWLDEKQQTEGVLNTVYSETAAYEENMAYYALYQAFEVISTKY